jgi:hypothetical protein
VRFTGEVKMTYALLRRLTYARFTPRNVAIVVGSVVLLFCCVVAATSPIKAVGWFAPAVALIPLFELMFRRSWLRIRNLANQPWQYEVSDTMVSVTMPATRATISWGEISKARIARHAWFFTMASSRAQMTVPRTAFSPDAQREIDTLVTAHVPSRKA